MAQLQGGGYGSSWGASLAAPAGPACVFTQHQHIREIVARLLEEELFQDDWLFEAGAPGVTGMRGALQALDLNEYLVPSTRGRLALDTNLLGKFLQECLKVCGARADTAGAALLLMLHLLVEDIAGPELQQRDLQLDLQQQQSASLHHQLQSQQQWWAMPAALPQPYGMMPIQNLLPEQDPLYGWPEEQLRLYLLEQLGAAEEQHAHEVLQAYTRHMPTGDLWLCLKHTEQTVPPGSHPGTALQVFRQACAAQLLARQRQQASVGWQVQGLPALRRYQLETVNSLCSDLRMNWVVVAPTGTGKTVMFVEHSRRLLEVNPAARIMVLVPNVALTNQHERVFKQAGFEHRGWPVGAFSSDNQLRPKNWHSVLRSTSVIITTSQSFLNVLLANTASFLDLALLVIDECHHIHKEAPEARIMELYRTTPVEQRITQVIGFTASPVNNDSYQGIVADMWELVSNMSAPHVAQLVVVPEDNDEVAEVIARPHDRTVTVGRRELDRDFGQQLRDWVVDQVSKVAMAWRALSKRGIRLRMPDAEAERALAVKDWQLKYTLQTTTSEASHPQLHMYLAGMASVYHAVGLLEQAVCCRLINRMQATLDFITEAGFEAAIQYIGKMVFDLATEDMRTARAALQTPQAPAAALMGMPPMGMMGMGMGLAPGQAPGQLGMPLPPPGMTSMTLASGLNPPWMAASAMLGMPAPMQAPQQLGGMWPPGSAGMEAPASYAVPTPAMAVMGPSLPAGGQSRLALQLRELFGGKITGMVVNNAGPAQQQAQPPAGQGLGGSAMPPLNPAQWAQQHGMQQPAVIPQTGSPNAINGPGYGPDAGQAVSTEVLERQRQQQQQQQQEEERAQEKQRQAALDDGRPRLPSRMQLVHSDPSNPPLPPGLGFEDIKLPCFVENVRSLFAETVAGDWKIVQRCFPSGDVRPGRTFPKFYALVEYLIAAAAARAEFHCIVFVATRRAVYHVASMIRQCRQLETLDVFGFFGKGKKAESANAGFLASTDVVRGMTGKRQISILEAFKGPGRKVLVATSAAEEGIDVPACDFVVRYHAAVTGKQRVQSSGRCRKKSGEFLCIVQDTTMERHLHHKSTAEQSYMQTFLRDFCGNGGAANAVPAADAGSVADTAFAPAAGGVAPASASNTGNARNAARGRLAAIHEAAEEDGESSSD